MKRERLTITLDTDLLAALDSTVDRSTIRNRSHAIEHFIREGLALGQFRQAFLFLDEEWDASTLPKLISLADAVGIGAYYLVQTAVTTSIAASAGESIRQLSQNHPLVETLPGDFGSGGALILKKAELSTPFLLVNCDAGLRLPHTLLSPFVFHRQQVEIATMLLQVEDGEFLPNGLTIANPELLGQIPAGQVSLSEHVFPALLKAGRVKAYICPDNLA